MEQAHPQNPEQTQAGSLSTWLRRVLIHPYFPVLVLILANLVIGAFLVPGYGESWDESRRYGQAWRSLRSYREPTALLNDDKGAFYSMVARVGANRIRDIYPAWRTIDAWHFMTFLSFQLGVFFFYALGLRLLNKWVALGTTLLFATQPLLWGHAFINPKDIPFMSFFLGSVACGLWMVDAALKRDAVQSTEHFEFSRAWGRLDQRTRSRVVLILALSGASLLALLLGAVIVRQPLAALVEAAYSAGPGTWLGKLFARLAEHKQTIPPEVYLQKGVLLYRRLSWYAAVLIAALAALGLARLLPAAFIRDVYRRLRPGLVLLLSTLLAALFLGLSASIRTLGPASGVLVAGYYFLKARWKSLPRLFFYFLIAAGVTYLTWPGLWGSPLTAYWDRLLKSAEFPWEGLVLFAGQLYPSNALPRSYLPELISLQFTEPALLLFLAGLVVAIYRLRKGALEWQLLALLAAWFFIPFTLALAIEPVLYDNFRHFLFLVPPLFLFAGLGLQALYDRLRQPVWRLLLLAVVILPGLVGLVRLHPYQYVYYNALAGGLPGAFRRYEMDYWMTSYQEAVDYLNQTAPQHSRIAVWGPVHLVKNYAREDLVVEEFPQPPASAATPPDYVVLPSRQNADLQGPPGEEVLRIGREGAIFTIIKHQPGPAQ